MAEPVGFPPFSRDRHLYRPAGNAKYPAMQAQPGHNVEPGFLLRRIDEA